MAKPDALFLAAALGLCMISGPGAAQQQQGEITGMQVLVMRDYLIEGRRTAILARDWLYCYPPSGELILVPAGYMTDFASIPQLPGVPFDPFGLHSEAAVVHDWLFAVGEEGRFDKANDVFLYAMMEQKVPVVQRFTMYQAVQLGGRGAYGRESEWMRRFGNPDTGRRLAAPPFRKPATAVVAQIDCTDLDDPLKVVQLRGQYGSATWPRP